MRGKRAGPGAMLVAALCATPILPAHSATSARYRTGLHEYVSGRHAWQQNDLTQATNLFAGALRYEDDDPVLLRRTFDLAVASGDMPRALDLGRTLRKTESSYGTLLFLLAVDALRQGNWRGAREQLDAVADSGIEGLIAPVLRAWTLYGAGDKAAAAALLARDDGDKLRRSYQSEHLAYMRLLTGDAAGAAGLLSELLPQGSVGGARARLSLAAAWQRAGDPAKARAALDAKDMQRFDGRLDEALATLAAGKPLPLIVTAPAQGAAELLLRAAVDLSRDQVTPLSLGYARMAQYLNPRLEETTLVLAEMLRAGGDAKGAALILDSPDNSAFYSARAAALRADLASDARDYDKALAILAQAVKRWPDDTALWVERGDTLRQKEDYAGAISAYDHAIAQLRTPMPTDWSIYFARGVAYERDKRWPQAEADLRKALSLKPDEPNVLNYLGYSWIDRGLNREEATRMIARAVEQRPDDGFILDSLGWAYFTSGDAGRAVVELEKAVALEPGDATLNEHLGDAYWQVGRVLEARFRWKAALALEPEPEQKSRLETKTDFGLVDSPSAPRQPG